MSDPASPLSPPGVDGAPASGAPPPGPPPGMPNNLFEAKPLTNHHSTMLGVTIPFMVFCWLALLVAWLGGGWLALTRGLYVHGVWFLGWLLAGAAGALVLLGVTLSRCWRRRAGQRR